MAEAAMNSKILVTIAMAAAFVASTPSSWAEDAKPKAKTLPTSPHQAGRPPLKTRPVGDQAIKRTVADAMGFIRGMGPGETNKSLNRLQWIGAGQMTDGGVVYPVSRYSYQVSLHLKAAREDITRTARGKEQRLVHVVVDQQAWDEREPGVDELPASEPALNRRLQLARTPIGFTRAMLDADQATIKVTDNGPGKVAITFAVEGVPINADLNADYRPEVITMTIDGKEYVDRYHNYQDLSEYGIMFATRWTETVAGKPRFDVTFTETRVASYAVFPKPVATQAAK
jgi:hypothetical protein